MSLWRAHVGRCMVCGDPFWLSQDYVCLPCRFGDGVATTEQLRDLWMARRDRAEQRAAAIEELISSTPMTVAVGAAYIHG